MNCSKCNIPAAPHELIGGLCHKCSHAYALGLASDIENLSECVREWGLAGQTLHHSFAAAKLKLDALSAELEEYRSLAEKVGAGNAVSERDAALERATKAEAANAQMREAIRTVISYFSKEGTGKVFHLGYGGDREREAMLQAALSTNAGHGWLSPQDADKLRSAIRFPLLKAGNAKAMAFHVRQPFAGLDKESLAVWLEALAASLTNLAAICDEQDEAK